MTHAMRVVMMIHGYYPRIGGAERQLGALAPLLCERGFDVHVVTRRFHGLLPYEVIDGVPVHRLPAPGPKVSASLAFTGAAVHRLRQLRPHIIHAHEFFSTTTAAVLAKMLLHIPIIVTAHRSGPPGDVQRLQQKFLGAQRLALFCKYVDTFITISQDIDQELQEVGVKPAQRCAISNGVDTQRFTGVSMEEKKRLRASLHLPEEAPLVVFAGRLAPEKRVQHLLAIWPAVTAAHPEAVLLVVGTGEEETQLKKAAGPGIRFVGAVDDVRPYLRSADLFVLPSVAEGLSVAVLEAMASQLPVIATNVGGTADVIESGRNGCIVAPDDVSALQEAVLSVLADPLGMLQMGYQSRERVLRNHALPVLTDRLSVLYEQLAARYNDSISS